MLVKMIPIVMVTIIGLSGKYMTTMVLTNIMPTLKHHYVR